MSVTTKLIALYLPQFHCIPENDAFWGTGFTDWITVRNARPLYDGHIQPRVPLNNNYYDLANQDNVKWQAKLAQEHGIYGFGVYHYWFNNEKNLLTRPAEIMRDTADLGIKYFFVWDNCHWKRSWSNVSGNDWAPISDQNMEGPEVLVPYILGTEPDWETHYRYLSSHFHADNYERRNNRPVIGIIHYSRGIEKMCHYWDELARADGFDGLFIILKDDPIKPVPRYFYRYRYEPHFSGWDSSIKRVGNRLLRTLFPWQKEGIRFYDYDKIWHKLIHHAESCQDNHVFFGAYVSYDDTPRRGMTRSRVIRNSSPDKFANYLSKLIRLSEIQGKDYVFLTAWNEWGEGAYMEPDELYGYRYLEAVKQLTDVCD